MGRLGHLLLGTHRTAMVGWRTPSKVLLLLLLQEPLLDILGKHGLGRLWHWGATTCTTLRLLPWP